jgi:hypothetical protein
MSNQPKVAVELETVSLRLRAQLGRSVERRAKYVGSSTDRTYLASEAIEIALREHAEPQKTLSPDPPAPVARSRHSVPAVPTHVQSTHAPGGARLARPASSHRAPVLMPALAALLAGPRP